MGVFLSILIVLTAVLPAWAKKTADTPKPVFHGIQSMSYEEARFVGFQPSAIPPTDTTFLGDWDFSAGYVCEDQGWTPSDRTVSPADYWHVDDFAGLGGGSFGRLVALEGTKSMWVGARPTGPENPYLCGYATLPGYGNDWDQRFCTKSCLNVGTNARAVLRIRPDQEDGAVEMIWKRLCQG